MKKPVAEKTPDPAAGGMERIAKRLARAGLCSRRDAERWIEQGRVIVNGVLLLTPALNVGPHDRIEVDGKPLPQKERTRLWLYNKPSGLVTSNRDPEGRPTIFEKMPTGLPRVMTVGRLDITTEGLLLLTNDGGLARVLELPQTGWLRRYRVRAHGRVLQTRLAALKDGIAVDGILYGSIEAAIDREQGSNIWLTVGLREGKNREVKRVLGALGLEVNRLIRVSYGPFQLGDLGEGQVREIRGRLLRDQLGERLIRESGADFEAPVLSQISVPSIKPAPSAEEGSAKQRDPKRSGGLVSSLDRLETKKPAKFNAGRTSKASGKPSGKKSAKMPEGEYASAKPENPQQERVSRPAAKPRRHFDKPGSARKGSSARTGGRSDADRRR
jgi:23S rRNA pseudouridine2605 synthase